jgi:glycosyltransferase involved in cell wall biosynthesis
MSFKDSKVICVHLLNDYSGSPKVLMQLLKGWTQNNIQTELYTCSGRTGFLSDIPNVKYNYFNYTWKKNPILRLINLLISQYILCTQILATAKKEDIIYINTVLPFGAAFAGKIKGCRIIYHIHETSVKPAILKSFLFGMVKWTATDVVYVSKFLAKTEPIAGKKIHILHNAIENEFLAKAESHKIEKLDLNNILMVCSLKAYKGVFEFIQLAEMLPGFKFKLVLNATKKEIEDFFSETNIPSNVSLSDSQTNLHPFYQWADLVLNLSQPDQWVETFGLTILEGMAYGNPAIVPPVGGVVELIENHKNGYRIHSNQTESIAEAIKKLSSETNLYRSFREHTSQVISKFKEDYFIAQNIQILTNR